MMIRNLAIVAVAGLVVSTATLSAAFFIAGPQNVINGAWTYGPHGWGGHWSHHLRDSQDDGPQTTRDIAWSGGEALDIEVPADIRYTQAPGPAKVTVTGPQVAVADLVIENGRFGYARDRDHDARFTVMISAPSVNRFTLESSGRLAIVGYRQDSLTLDLEGDTDVVAAGEAKSVKLSISGSADADLAAMKAQAADVTIEGSGSAKVAPPAEAKVDISGSGDVHLLTDPPKLATHISGSGQVTHGGQTVSGE